MMATWRFASTYTQRCRSMALSSSRHHPRPSSPRERSLMVQLCLIAFTPSIITQRKLEKMVMVIGLAGTSILDLVLPLCEILFWTPSSLTLLQAENHHLQQTGNRRLVKLRETVQVLHLQVLLGLIIQNKETGNRRLLLHLNLRQREADAGEILRRPLE